MKDKTRHEKNLYDGLNELPQYTPDGQVWDNIEGQLHLHTAIEQLASYEPSDAVWDNINESISTQARIRTIWRPLAAAAAMLALTIGTYWWTTSNSIQEEIHYATETIDNALFKEDWNTDEDGFQALAKLCSQKAFVCAAPTFQVLKSEIEELNIAKSEIESAMSKYGKQADFILKMKDIEQERSKVLKEMFAMI